MSFYLKRECLGVQTFEVCSFFNICHKCDVKLMRPWRLFFRCGGADILDKQISTKESQQSRAVYHGKWGKDRFPLWFNESKLLRRGGSSLKHKDPILGGGIFRGIGDSILILNKCIMKSMKKKIS